MLLDNKSVTNNRPFPIRREKDHHRQLVTVTCAGSSLLPLIGPQKSITAGAGGVPSKRYLLSIYSDFKEDEIPPPSKLILLNEKTGRQCFFNEKEKRFNCPRPKGGNHMVRIIGVIEPSIRYTVESSNENVS